MPNAPSLSTISGRRRFLLRLPFFHQSSHPPSSPFCFFLLKVRLSFSLRVFLFLFTYLCMFIFSSWFSDAFGYQFLMHIIQRSIWSWSSAYGSPYYWWSLFLFFIFFVVRFCLTFLFPGCGLGKFLVGWVSNEVKSFLGYYFSESIFLERLYVYMCGPAMWLSLAKLWWIFVFEVLLEFSFYYYLSTCLLS